MTPETLDNGWIEHDGDTCQVEGGVLLDVRRRDGCEDRVRALWTTTNWRDGGRRFWVTSDQHHSDIIAYRIAGEQS